MDRGKRIRRHLAAFVVFAALVGISNASLLPNLDRALTGGIHEDPYTATWLLGWELRSLTSLEFRDFWSPDLCYPDTEWSLSRLETHPGQALLANGAPDRQPLVARLCAYLT